MNAVLKPAQAAIHGQRAIEARFEVLNAGSIDAVLAMENRAYDFPWTWPNFNDALASGYLAQRLMAGDTLLGYFIAMQGVDEVHLLNITVAPECQRQGWARIMLDALQLWARRQGADWLWLEVRVGNLRAIDVYQTHGFRRVGLRKDYYPCGAAPREDAIVMSQKL